MNNMKLIKCIANSPNLLTTFDHKPAFNRLYNCVMRLALACLKKNSDWVSLTLLEPIHTLDLRNFILLSTLSRKDPCKSIDPPHAYNVKQNIASNYMSGCCLSS